MFQFRAFPSYGYLVHRTILRYCLSVFPHSEISGSSLICSSPKLFAACHVLHRLLMPRHSPCALISLTFVEEICAPLPSPLRSKPACAGLWIEMGMRLDSFVLVLIQNYAGSTEDLTQNCTYPYNKSFHNAVFYAVSHRALCCLAFSLLCSVFKVQTRIQKCTLKIEQCRKFKSRVTTFD